MAFGETPWLWVIADTFAIPVEVLPNKTSNSAKTTVTLPSGMSGAMVCSQDHQAANYAIARILFRASWMRDEETVQLERYMTESGLADREAIVTLFDYYDVDEGRKPLG